jgi:hypothetical protein
LPLWIDKRYLILSSVGTHLSACISGKTTARQPVPLFTALEEVG